MNSLPILTALAAFATTIPGQAHVVADLAPGITTSVLDNSVAPLGESVVFSALVAGEVGLYTSDGTTAGTTRIMVLSTATPYSAPSGFTTVGSTVYFSWWDSTAGRELWKTDGTAAGTVRVADIRPGGSGSYPSSFANVGGTLYFSAAATSGNYELWRSDGSAAGTVVVKDIHPTAGSAVAHICQLGTTSSFLFSATDGLANGWELWKSDGTTAGTVLVKDIKPGGGGVSSSRPAYLTPFGSQVAFAAAAVGNDYELWLSDGTAAGTYQVTIDRFEDSGPSGPRHIVAQNGRLFFQAEPKGPGYGNELFVSDGTNANTSSIAAVGGFMMTAVGSRYVYFNGGELWRTDGTVLGTSLYQELWVGSGYGDPSANGYPSSHLYNARYAVTTDGKMFFFASDPTNGKELWVHDTGVNSTTTAHGTACSGLTLAATTPFLGETCTITTSAIPATAVLSALALSFTRHSPPIDLSSYGMPGCYQHVGLDSVHFLVGTPTTSFALAIPPGSSWLGARIQCQSFAFVPGINAAGAISSNGLELVFGNQ